MAATTKKPFSSSTINDGQKNLTKASAVVQTYVQMVLQQPDLKLDALPKLPDHQETARKHAIYWDDTLIPGMILTNSDIIDYANQFQSFYEVLVGYAKDVENPDSRKKLVEGLSFLHKNIQTKHDNVEKVATDLSSFQTSLTSDYQNFEGDVNEAATKIEGDKGELKALSKELDAIQDAMNKDIGMMAGGAVMMIGGIAMIVVGALAEIPSGGATTALIGGGVLVTAGGIAMETLGAKDYDDEIDKQTKVQEKISTDKQQLVGLKSTKGQLGGFVRALSSSISATQALKQSWQTLGSDLKEVIEAIDRVDSSIPADFIVAELKTANSDWKVALDLAKQLQPNGKVSTKLYTNLKDAFKTMRKG